MLIRDAIIRLRNTDHPVISLGVECCRPSNHEEVKDFVETLFDIGTRIESIEFYFNVWELSLLAQEQPPTSSYFGRIFDTHHSLKYLFLPANHLTDVHAISISKSLLNNTSLLELHLASNYIGESGFHAILQSLRENKTLKYLQLGYNNIEVRKEKAKELTTSIKMLSLKRLFLSNNPIGDVGADAIAEGIKKNLHLEQASGCHAIACALKHNCTLQWLNISDNAGLLVDDDDDNIKNAGAVQASFENSLRHNNYALSLFGIGSTELPWQHTINELC